MKQPHAWWRCQGREMIVAKWLWYVSCQNTPPPPPISWDALSLHLPLDPQHFSFLCWILLCSVALLLYLISCQSLTLEFILHKSGSFVCLILSSIPRI